MVAEGVIDLEDELWGEVFEPLKDLDVFRCFRVDTELDTIVWPTRCRLGSGVSSTSTRRTVPPHDNGGSARPSSRNAVASGSKPGDGGQRVEPDGVGCVPEQPAGAFDAAHGGRPAR